VAEVEIARQCERLRSTQPLLRGRISRKRKLAPLSCKNPARCVGERVGAGTLTFERRTPTYRVNTIDGDGMNEALEKHSEQLQRHMEKAVRKMNG
jgi:hypothetical protein